MSTSKLTLRANFRKLDFFSEQKHTKRGREVMELCCIVYRYLVLFCSFILLVFFFFYCTQEVKVPT